LPPVLPSYVAALRIREDERARVRATEREVELGELGGDRPEQLGGAGACTLRRPDVTFGEAADDAEPVAGPTTIEDVSPFEGERLARAQAFVGEDAYESGIGEANRASGRALDDRGANGLYLLGRARVDRRVAHVRKANEPDDWVRRQPSPLDCSSEDTLQDRQRSVGRRRAGARGT